MIVPSFDGKVTIDGNTVTGGSTQRLTGTVTLDTPPSEDRVIDFASSILSVPGPVIVTKGKTTTKFNVYAYHVSESTPSALFADNAWIGAVTIVPNTISSVTMASPFVEGGKTTTGVVTMGLSMKDAYWMTIECDDARFSATTCYFAPGSRTGTFTFRTGVVPASTKVTLTASYASDIRRSTTITVNPRPVVKAVSLASAMYGNQKITGTVKLENAADASGATVTISGDGLLVDGTVFVPAGSKSATFTVTAADPSTTTLHHLTFGTSTSVLGKDVTVYPNPILNVDVASPSVKGGTSVTGTVTLTKPVDVDTVIALSSGKLDLANVPATVTILAGASSATFEVSTNTVTKTKNVSISAAKNGLVKKVSLSVAR